MFGKKKKEKVIDFERLQFPLVEDTKIVFGGYPKDWFEETLKEAKEEGITAFGNNEWVNKFSGIFFKGEKVEVNKKLDSEYLKNGIRMFNAVAGSFNPKHEDKTVVCALILRSICS